MKRTWWKLKCTSLSESSQSEKATDRMILCDLPEKAKTRETAQRPAGSRCLEGGTSQ